jgi:hypothetical protein
MHVLTVHFNRSVSIMNLLALFVDADDFCRVYQQYVWRQRMEATPKRRDDTEIAGHLEDLASP